MSQANTGDLVEVNTESETIKGILMPRPDILDDDIVVIKLESGYNMGIHKDKIKSIIQKKEYSKKVKKHAKIKLNKNLPNVAVLSTGGTISSKIDYRTGGVYADYTAEDFLDMMPEIANHVNLRAEKVMEIMSEDITPEDWSEIARNVLDASEGTNGVVLTHGTDTMHYTAAALSFMLQGFNRPVIITGAQRSIDRGSSDAFMNLKCACIAAGRKDLRGVFTCMHGTSSDDYCLLIKGTKVRKMHTSKRDAFRPINDLAVAKVFYDGHVEFIQKDEKRSNQEIFGEFSQKSNQKIFDGFEKKIALITIYPGMDPGIIKYYIDKKIKGIVLAATALGHVPTIKDKYSLLENLKEANDKGIKIVIATQSLYGRVHPYVYTNLRKLSVQLGCIFAEDMTPETAYVKMGWTLANCEEKDFNTMFKTDLVGEINRKTDPRTFLY